MENGVFVVIAMLIIILATISTNTAANIVSPTNDFQNVMPKLIDMKRGVLATGIIGFLLVAWELLRIVGWVQSNVSVEAVYSGWLLTYSSLLGPIAGIMVVDFFLIKNKNLNVLELYKNNGIYAGWGWRAQVAFFIPAILALLGTMVSSLNWFYSYGWFTGSILGGLLYFFLAREQN